MFAYFKGIVEKIEKSAVVIDVNNIGYKVNISSGDEKTLLTLINKEVKLEIYTDIKENDISLYGFIDRQALSVFCKLIKVSGVGCKAAINILSYMTPQDICIVIANEQTELLVKVPGIGTKTAARIILELKDKILKEDSSIIEKSVIIKNKTNTYGNEAVLALKVLGYNQMQITEVLNSINTEGLNVEQIIRKVLSNIK